MFNSRELENDVKWCVPLKTIPISELPHMLQTLPALPSLNPVLGSFADPISLSTHCILLCPLLTYYQIKGKKKHSSKVDVVSNDVC